MESALWADLRDLVALCLFA